MAGELEFRPPENKQVGEEIRNEIHEIIGVHPRIGRREIRGMLARRGRKVDQPVVDYLLKEDKLPNLHYGDGHVTLYGE